MKPVIGITMRDAAGIGPELILIAGKDIADESIFKKSLKICSESINK
ncbi:MAG: hypothetical protein M1409_09870 [Actinobacteria bacterium]|nr:hypothetical protein [Actinomycetota bacterium]